MEKVMYVVDGWDGDTEYFHNEENAKKEFVRRLEEVKNYELTIDNEDGHTECRFWDEMFKTWFFLTLDKVKFSD
jgi:hypothetical protein